MSKRTRILIYVVGIILVLSSSYFLVMSPYGNSTDIVLIVLALVAGLFVFARPLWGVYLIFLLSPLRTFGSEVILLARLLGMWTVFIIFLSLLARRNSIQWSGLEGPIVLVVLGMSLSFFRTENFTEVALTILSLMSLYGLLLVIINVVQEGKQFLNIAIVFLLSSALPSIMAIVQRLQGTGLDISFVRVSGTFTLPTGLGGFLIPVIITAAALLFYPHFSNVFRWLILTIFGLGTAALLLTLSRGAILGVLPGLLVLLFQLRSEIRQVGKALTVGLISVVAALSLYIFWSPVRDRVIRPVVDYLVTGSTTWSSLTSRTYDLALTIRLPLDTGFMGTGIGNYAQAMPRYRLLYDAPQIPGFPHNVFLYFFGEVGIVGAVGFIWMLIWLARHVRANHQRMTAQTGASRYIYFGSVASLIAYTSYLLTHGAFFQNEIWIAIAFLIVSISLAQNFVHEPSEGLARRFNRFAAKGIIWE